MASYTEICRRLIHDIRRGVYPPGSRLPSKTALMRLFDVSDGPAKRAMLELVREGFAYAVPGKGWYVSSASNGTPRVPSRVRADSHPPRLLFISGSVLHEFNAPILRGILDIAQSRGYRVEVCDSGGSYRTECVILTRCFVHPPAGVLFCAAHSDRAYPQLAQLRRRGIPVVLIGERVSGVDAPFVGSADFVGARTATNHLIALHHRRIAFLGVQYLERNSTLQERFAGYQRALKSAGIRFDPSLALFGDRRMFARLGPRACGHYSYRILRAFLRPPLRFTGAVAFNDSAALAACHALAEYGLSVPEHLSIVGFDNLQEGQRRERPLTTIGFDTRRIGAAAARMCIALIEKKPTATTCRVPVKLVLGATTAKVSGGSKP